MGARIRLAIALGLLSSGFGCQKPPTPAPVPSPTPSDVCTTFCAVVGRLGCPQAAYGPGVDEVAGSADDTPCPVVCSTLLSSALFKSDAACMAKATTCDQAETCLLGPVSP